MKRVLAMLLVLAMAVALCACGGSSAPAASTETPAAPAADAAPAAPAFRDTLNIAVDVDPQTFSPVQYNNSTANRVAEFIYDGLVRLDSQMAPQPCLAESWEISEDSLTWTFNLRSGVKFHDGSDFTSADVKYTYENMLNPDNSAPYRSRYTSIDTIECPDDNTVIFNLATPNVAMMAYLDLPIIPEGAVEDPNFATAPIGTGVYKVEKYELNNVTSLVANENYWGEPAATPNLNVYVINDNSVRLAALEAGDVDFICSPLTASDLVLVESNPDLVMTKVAGLGFTYLGCSMIDPIMSDLAVRQAVALCIDKQSISKVIYANMDIPAETPLLSGSWANDGSLHGYEFNPEKAAQVLEDAGWVDTDGDGVREKDGVKLEVTVATHTDDTSRFQVVELMQNQLQKIGFSVSTSVTEWASFSAKMDEKAHQIWVAGWLNLVDPDRMYGMFYTDGPNNYGGFSDPAVDAALDTARQSSDQAVRSENYQFVAQTVADQAHYNVLVEQAFVAIHSAKLTGYEIFPNGSYRTLAQATIAE